MSAAVTCHSYVLSNRQKYLLQLLVALRQLHAAYMLCGNSSVVVRQHLMCGVVAVCDASKAHVV